LRVLFIIVLREVGVFSAGRRWIESMQGFSLRVRVVKSCNIDDLLTHSAH